jgi:pimeloyl-ACP methyl ester carboxylesterase
MDRSFSRSARAALAAVVAALGVLGLVAAPAGAMGIKVSRVFMPSFKAPGTPEPFKSPKGSHLPKEIDLNQVGVIKVGSPTAKNVLVFEPGTSAGAAYFVPLAKSLVEHTQGWQVWAVERRQNLLEDQSEINKAKKHKVTGPEVFCYYLGFLVGGGCAKHFLPLAPGFIPAGEAKAIKEFGDEWGMNVAVEDLHTVIESAKALGGKVVLGGHSLGGSVVTAYATWDFAGSAGADGLSGLIFDDGGSSPIPISKEAAEEKLATLHGGESPWLSFGGIPSPFLGLFSALGSGSTILFPEEAAAAESFPLLPENLKPKNPAGCKLSEAGCEQIPVTNEALFGFGVNVGTSPPNLIAAQIHAGKGIEPTAKEDGLHGWNDEGALTPLHRYAEMLSGAGISSSDGTEWYFPERLTLDTGAVAEGNANPAQEVLGLHAIHGHELPTSLKILAINSELDKFFGANSLQAAEILAEQSGIPKSNLTLIEREESYAHNDPNGADPEKGGIFENAFFKELVPYLEVIANNH